MSAWNQAGKKVSHYSLGMKQRLGIAMALMRFPKLLVLDEPTNGLDPAGIEEIRELIKALPQQYGMTVMLSSHLLAEVDQMATAVGIIDHGELIFQNSLEVLPEEERPLCGCPDTGLGGGRAPVGTVPPQTRGRMAAAGKSERRCGGADQPTIGLQRRAGIPH